MTTCYTDDYFSQILLRSVESILLNHEQYNANPSSKQFFLKKQFCAIKNKFPLKKKSKKLLKWKARNLGISVGLTLPLVSNEMITTDMMVQKTKAKTMREHVFYNGIFSRIHMRWRRIIFLETSLIHVCGRIEVCNYIYIVVVEGYFL